MTMLKCREVTRLVASDEVLELGFLKRMQLRMHLLMCRHCSGYAAQIRHLGEGAREAAGRETCPPQRLEEIEREIIDHTQRPGS